MEGFEQMTSVEKAPHRQTAENIVHNWAVAQGYDQSSEELESLVDEIEAALDEAVTAPRSEAEDLSEPQVDE